MKDIITWLIEMERVSGNLYKKALSMFNNDEEFERFLKQMCEDEAWHFHIMGSALSFI